MRKFLLLLVLSGCSATGDAPPLETDLSEAEIQEIQFEFDGIIEEIERQEEEDQRQFEEDTREFIQTVREAAELDYANGHEHAPVSEIVSRGRGEVPASGGEGTQKGRSIPPEESTTGNTR